jgi:hypothetical protein
MRARSHVRSRSHGGDHPADGANLGRSHHGGRQFASQSASGFGDPMLEFNINLIGPPAQKNIPDVLRYEPGFSVDLLADLALPIGEYDSTRS